MFNYLNRNRMSRTLNGSLLVISLVCAATVVGARAPRAVKEGRPKIKRTLGEDVGSIGCQLQDKAGNIWFCTAGSGVFRFDGGVGDGGSFTNFTTDDGLSDNSVSAIIQDKLGNIVFGTGKGICQFDGKTFIKRSDLGERKITCLLGRSRWQPVVRNL